MRREEKERGKSTQAETELTRFENTVRLRGHGLQDLRGTISAHNGIQRPWAGAMTDRWVGAQAEKEKEREGGRIEGEEDERKRGQKGGEEGDK